jgi:hypothetical protein
VTEIGETVFKGCVSLTNIVIPNSVTSIGEWAFSGCESLSSVMISDSVTTLGKCAFQRCLGMTSIEIPASVTSIDENTFEGTSNALKNIVVAEGNKHYDSRGGCNAIIKTKSNKLLLGCQSTIIPDTVTSIGRFAFRNCSSLEVITIPAKVEVIRECAFAGCNRMRFVCALGSEPAQLNGNPFPAALRTIFVPRSDVRAYKTAWMSYAMFIRGNKE